MKKSVKVLIGGIVSFAMIDVAYLLVIKQIWGQAGLFGGGFVIVLLLLSMLTTFTKSPQQRKNELKYMSDVHDNHRPRIK